jgi:hypothetical protein
MKRDQVLFTAILIAVVCPALPGLDNPGNISILLLLFVLLNAGINGPIKGLTYCILAMGSLICISTIAGLLFVEGLYSINQSVLGPYLRIVICFQAMRCADDPSRLHRWLLWLGVIASIFALLQFLLPTIVATFTAEYYLASERSSVFGSDFSEDTIVRIIGFFENPSSVGLLSIVFILLTIRFFSLGKLGLTTLTFFLVIHFGAGILSLSKVFFMGLPLIMLQLIVLRYFAAIILGTFIAISGFYLVINSDASQMQVIRYAFETTFNLDAALNNRYLNEVLSILVRSWVLGYGLVAIDNIVVNDSAYLVLGYFVGIFGVLVVAALSMGWLWRWRHKVSDTLYLILAIILIAGVGTNSILGFRVDIFLTASCAILFAAVLRPNNKKGLVKC